MSAKKSPVLKQLYQKTKASLDAGHILEDRIKRESSKPQYSHLEALFGICWWRGSLLASLGASLNQLVPKGPTDRRANWQLLLAREGYLDRSDCCR